MFNKLLLCILALALSPGLYAQKFDPEKMHFSANVGLNVSWFSSDVGIFNKSYPGYATSQYAQYDKYIRASALVNVNVDYQLGPKFWIAGGLAYSGRGGAYQTEVKGITVHDSDGKDVTVDNVYVFKIDYLELPLLAQYNLAKQTADRSVIVYGGIAPAIRVGTATRYIYYPDDVNPASVDDTKVKAGGLTNVNVFNLHPILGLQFGDQRSKNNFFIDLHFEMSALPVFNNSPAYFNTQMWTGSLGLGFRGSIIPYHN